MQDTWRIPRWFDPQLYVRTSEIDGSGVFTRRPFAVGDEVMRWGGLVVPRSQFTPARFRSRSTTAYDAEHWLTEVNDAPPLMDDMLNHGCDPNVWMSDTVTVVARRPIAADEEILIDAALYLDEPDYVHADPCRCGSPLCRREIRGYDWQRPELQVRYAGHFCTFLNDRIAALTTRAPSSRVRAPGRPA